MLVCRGITKRPKPRVPVPTSFQRAGEVIPFGTNDPMYKCFLWEGTKHDL